MAVSTLQSNAKGIVPVGHISGGSGSIPTLQGREGSTQTFIQGAVLKLSSGLLIEASDGDATGLVGIAAEPASGTANTLINYYPIGVDVIWEATLEDQSNTDHALVVTNVGTKYGLYSDAAGNWYVNENDTSTTAVYVYQPRDWQDVTDATVRARVKIRFIEDSLDQHKD